MKNCFKLVLAAVYFWSGTDFGYSPNHPPRTSVNSAISFHDLRHTFAAHFMMNGGNIFELQKILGHTKVEMTMRYAHFSQEHLHQATRHMDLGVSFEIEESEPYLNPNLENQSLCLVI